MPRTHSFAQAERIQLYPFYGSQNGADKHRFGLERVNEITKSSPQAGSLWLLCSVFVLRRLALDCPRR
jgi:hypothetical protein